MLNPRKLRQAEAAFLSKFPGGFDHPEMVRIGKTHKMDTMVALAQSCFSKKASRDIETYTDNMVKVVSRSSMVSMFEKPKFRDFVRRLDSNEQAFLVKAMHQILHGKQHLGFAAMVDLLQTEKLAKWSIISIIPAYYAPMQEVFVKPTTTKNVLKHFDVPDLVYKPLPSWDFYSQYRQLIHDAKASVDACLSPSNAAFSGFLMMSMPKS